MSDIKALAGQFFPQGYPELAEQWLDFAEHVAAEREAQAVQREREAARGLAKAVEYAKDTLQLVHDACEPHEDGIKEQLAVAIQNLADAAATYNDNRKG